LLDILSKGSNPQLVLKHLPKCFDNIKTLEFNKDADGHPTKESVGMYSGEMEYVPFHASFHCEGPVETWLFNLTVHTHECLKQILVQAVAVYEDKPKHEFVLDWYAYFIFLSSKGF
jgi:dynein heavy chain